MCSFSEPRNLGVSISDSVALVCDVVAHPTDLKFHWRFNSTAEPDAEVDFFDAGGSGGVDYVSNGTRDDHIMTKLEQRIRRL